MHVSLVDDWQEKQDLIFHRQKNYTVITQFPVCTLTNKKYKVGGSDFMVMLIIFIWKLPADLPQVIATRDMQKASFNKSLWKAITT